MKIINQNYNHLTLQEVPRGFWLFGGCFIFFGLLSTVIAINDFGKFITFQCKRQESLSGNCELVHSSLLSSTTKNISLETLQEAKVNEIIQNGNKSYEIILIAQNQEISFSPESESNPEKQQKIATKINYFINNPQENSLLIRKDNRLSGYLMGMIVGSPFTLMGGLIILIFGAIVTVDIDKNLSCLSIQKKGVLGAKIIEYKIREIAEIVVENYNSTKGRKNYRVALVFQSGDRIPMTLYYSSGKAEKQKMAEAIAEFLDLEALEADKLYNLRSVASPDAETQQALTELQDTLSQNLSSLRVNLAIAQSKILRETWKIFELKQQTWNYPNNPNFYYRLGKELQKQERIPEAIIAIEKAKEKFALKQKSKKVKEMKMFLEQLNR